MPRAVHAGRVIADSADTKLVEGNVYFPGESVDRDLLVESATQYTCPWKGEATYYHLVTDEGRIEDAAWAYHQPKPAAAQITGHFAFDTRKGVEVER